ncbi:unnamed protein product, partial [Prorocentrum cordatum]
MSGRPEAPAVLGCRQACGDLPGRASRVATCAAAAGDGYERWVTWRRTRAGEPCRKAVLALAVDALRRVPTEFRLGNRPAVVGAEKQLTASPGGGQRSRSWRRNPISRTQTTRGTRYYVGVRCIKDLASLRFDDVRWVDEIQLSTRVAPQAGADQDFGAGAYYHQAFYAHVSIVVFHWMKIWLGLWIVLRSSCSDLKHFIPRLVAVTGLREVAHLYGGFLLDLGSLAGSAPGTFAPGALRCARELLGRGKKVAVVAGTPSRASTVAASVRRGGMPAGVQAWSSGELVCRALAGPAKGHAGSLDQVLGRFEGRPPRVFELSSVAKPRRWSDFSNRGPTPM